MESLIQYLQKEKKLKPKNVTDKINLSNFTIYSKDAINKPNSFIYFTRTTTNNNIFKLALADEKTNIIIFYKDNFCKLAIENTFTEEHKNILETIFIKSVCNICKSDFMIYCCQSNKCLVCYKCLIKSLVSEINVECLVCKKIFSKLDDFKIRNADSYFNSN